MNIDLTCPNCQFRQAVPFEKIPAGTTMATCPRCQSRFPLGTPATTQEETQANGVVAVRSLGRLFDEAWGLFSKRWATLVGLHLLTYTLLFLPTGLGFAAGFLTSTAYPDLKRELILLGTFSGLLIGLFAMFWGYAAFMAAITDPQLSFKAALQRGRQLLSPFLWAVSLSGTLIMGASVLFFIPGIMMTVWFLFIPFILIETPSRGMQALKLSRYYVDGYWWEVFGKFFIVSLVPSAISAIPIVGPFIGLLAVPYVTLMLFLIYQDQKLRRPPEAMASQGRSCLSWWLVALAGYALIIIPLLYFWGSRVEETVKGIAL